MDQTRNLEILWHGFLDLCLKQHFAACELLELAGAVPEGAVEGPKRVGA